VNKKMIEGIFYCPSCGINMQTNSEGDLICPHCGQKDQICAANQDTEDFDFAAAEAASSWNEPMIRVRCTACAAQVARTDGEPLQVCPYCTSSALTATEEPFGIRPGWVAPFKINAVQAATIRNAWLKKNLLVPFAFSKEHSIGSFMGVFLPYWSFDATAKSAYTGQAGNYYHETEVNTVSTDERTETKNKRVRKIRWRMVSGNYDKKFGDIIFGDSGIDPQIVKDIEPFKLSELVKYDSKYSAGFSIERYSIGLKDMWERAKLFISTKLREDITAIVRKGSNVMGTVNICTHYSDIGYKLLLLPIWISSYRFRDKIYQVYINGQTGEICGHSPVSALKIGIIAFVLLAIAALLILVL
jgi:DNA-directed RNA polymerase subunit RPC12/RpoP